MSFVRCNNCGATLDATGLEESLSQHSGSASSSFYLFDVAPVFPPLECPHCSSTDLSPVEQPASPLPDSAQAAASNDPSRYHSSAPPVSREASGRPRPERPPTAVGLALVGVFVLTVVLGLFQAFGTHSNPPMKGAVGGLATRNDVPYPGETFHVGKLEWQLTPAGGAMDWQSAKIYCDTLSLTGGGWRMPSRDELDALYASKPHGNAAKPGMDRGSYWSSSTSTDISVHVHGWLVNFHTGSTEIEDLSSDYSVRCVR